jgi:hypothetical protein
MMQNNSHFQTDFIHKIGTFEIFRKCDFDKITKIKIKTVTHHLPEEKILKIALQGLH